MYNFAPGPYYEIIFDAPSEECFNHPNRYRYFSPSLTGTSNRTVRRVTGLQRTYDLT